ncbi:MAG TPA: pyridoxamine 5'-phosphate oxidase family protein [Capsulimonadaceae bacterium]
MAKLPDNIIKVLDGGHPFWVATATTDGHPNIAVKGSGAVADSEHLYFADRFSMKTRENLEANPHVAIGVSDPEAKVAVQIKGRALLWDHGTPYDTVVAKLRVKKPTLPSPAYVVVVTIDSVWDMSGGPLAGEQIA